VLCEQGQLYKVSKNKDGIVSDQADQALDRLGGLLGGGLRLPAAQGDHQGRRWARASAAWPPAGLRARRRASWRCREFEERWTGGYIFENEWQSFRTRQS
jgi:hypothetical protein